MSKVSTLAIVSLFFSTMACGQSISLYQPDGELKLCFGGTAVPLAEYAERVISTIEATYTQEATEPSTYAVVVAIRPENRSKAWFVTAEDFISADTSTAVVANVEQLASPDIGCEIALFAVSMEVGGGGKAIVTDELPIPIPEEWRLVAGKDGPVEAGVLALRAWEASNGT